MKIKENCYFRNKAKKKFLGKKINPNDLDKGWQTFFKDQIIIISGFQTILSLSQLFNSTTCSWKVIK